MIVIKFILCFECVNVLLYELHLHSISVTRCGVNWHLKLSPCSIIPPLAVPMASLFSLCGIH